MEVYIQEFNLLIKSRDYLSLNGRKYVVKRKKVEKGKIDVKYFQEYFLSRPTIGDIIAHGWFDFWETIFRGV